MDSLSPAIAPKSFFRREILTNSSAVIPSLWPSFSPLCKKICVHAENTTPTPIAPAIDFSDPHWKSKFQNDFEARFNIPHLTDIFHDALPIPSTFCLKMRTPQKTLLMGIHLMRSGMGHRYSSPTSAGAECIDPDCTWVEQWVHRAGPRERIYFKPEEVKAAIVTCGGLCPGLNDVIRQIVITLEIYGVKKDCWDSFLVTWIF
ncbi:hypothetical protein LOK49_LG01G02237 [Camellia lanceoleosa]|uniref:Uncharacterized protein n=1 Tax=Camellia lanceoleosa TaxID=1840588 RepID=A0ACC0ITY4_9ERIC|nr:hypothetical protein LOK49_LG01G02237 [Camellia lanceoleosa]